MVSGRGPQRQEEIGVAKAKRYRSEEEGTLGEVQRNRNGTAPAAQICGFWAGVGEV